MAGSPNVELSPTRMWAGCLCRRRSSAPPHLLQLFQHSLRGDRIICHYDDCLCLYISLNICHAIHFAQYSLDCRGTSLTFVFDGR
jgi:hypothetical protein